MIRIAILVFQAVEEVDTIPTLELNKDIVDLDIADPEPSKISVKFKCTFFLFNDFYFCL